ncbi:MAG: hypothetical protein VXW65_09910 [Pseudomonadota bacterium]|nr:hypothetical protein [Pseudomonadota bacterium]
MTLPILKRRLAQLEAALNLIHEGVQYGVDTVEGIHQGIIDVPLEQLHLSGVIDLDQQRRQQLWNGSFGVVYSIIRRSNQVIQTTEEKIFSALDEQIDAQNNLKRIEYHPETSDRSTTP